MKKILLNKANSVLEKRGYAIRPLGNEHKKIDILAIGQFGRLAKCIVEEKMTYLKEDRLYTLWQALGQALNLGGDIAEIGVFRGGSAKFIASTMKLKDKSDVTLHLFDTFEGMPEQQVKVDNRQKGGFEGTSIDLVKSYLSEFANIRFYKGLVQDNAHSVRDMKFSMVHIDVDIYEPCKFCLKFFGDRLNAGGIIVLDDYGFTTCPGVKKAAEEFLKDGNGMFCLFHLLTGQAIMLKVR